MNVYQIPLKEEKPRKILPMSFIRNMSKKAAPSSIDYLNDANLLREHVSESERLLKNAYKEYLIYKDSK